MLALFGDNKKALEDLTVGTDEYREAIEKLTEAEPDRYRGQADTAQRAAEELLADLKVPNISGGEWSKVVGALPWEEATT